jgi:NAD(P)-dependent dehydrogenase (short-subunit alcohol dehydrogenase family)
VANPEPRSDATFAWSEAHMPRQAGRSVVITGASAGIGAYTARALARAGARVTIACRNEEAAAGLIAQIAAESPAARPEFLRLDLASLGSVRTAAERLLETHDRIDLLINNAGVMEPPYTRTEDGFELTFATNHLGHFAFTGLLIGLLARNRGARVVAVSSEGHVRGTIDLEDLNGERGYKPDRAYCQSKLANLLFAYELERRLRSAEAEAISLACHPGIVLTDLYRTRPRVERLLMSPRLRLFTSRLAQGVQMGALPTLRAATDLDARGGEFYGPARNGRTGHPRREESSPASHDLTMQRKLWEASEKMTGVTFPL